MSAHWSPDAALAGPGTLLSVPAGVGFEDFTDDFSTWVLFHGPQGGEHDA